MARLPPLLPQPKTTRLREGAFRLRGELPIVLPSGSTDGDFRAACALRNAVSETTGLFLPVETHVRRDDLGSRIELLREGDAGQGYRLNVTPERITIAGAGAAGARYGVETLRQLLAARRRQVPALAIEDAPDLEKRGLLVDISRGKVPTLATLTRLVDLMVSWKLNLLMLYTEHVFRFRRHPEIGKDAWPMSAAELRELDAYAAERHVELVPTLQSLGHMHHVLKLHRYRHLAESERRWSLSPAVEDTYCFLEELYSEYLPNFRSAWLNANCDEPVDLGKGKSKRWAEKEGLGAVYLAHLERVRSLAGRLGKKTMVWGDVVHEHPEAIPRLPRELMLLDWWYEAEHDYDRVRVFRDHGISFMVCPGTSSWNTLFPRVGNAIENIRGYAEAGKRFGAKGLVTTDWGDGGHYNLLGNSLFCFAFGAQAGWGASEVDGAFFDRAFSLHLFGDSAGAAGKIYRGLGRLHRTGFDHFNHSPLKSLYYDDVTEAKFIARIRPRELTATLRGLKRVHARFESHFQRLSARPQDRDELRFAIDASIVAGEKGLAGYDYWRWRQDPAGWNRRERGRLARKLSALAAEQARLRRRLEKLWLARNRPSNFEITSGYYDVSIRSLRRAARQLGR